MRKSGFILVGIVLSLILVPAVQAQQDLVKNAENITVTLPAPGAAIAGTKEAMYQYQTWLDNAIAPLISLFNQIMALFGLQNTDYTKRMQDVFQMGQNMTKMVNFSPAQ
jgi:hypothetical protein